MGRPASVIRKAAIEMLQAPRVADEPDPAAPNARAALLPPVNPLPPVAAAPSVPLVAVASGLPATEVKAPEAPKPASEVSLIAATEKCKGKSDGGSSSCASLAGLKGKHAAP